MPPPTMTMRAWSSITFRQAPLSGGAAENGNWAQIVETAIHVRHYAPDPCERQYSPLDLGDAGLPECATYRQSSG